MKKEMKKLVKIAEKLDWGVEADEKELLLRKYSPAGQDFSITINAESFDKAVEEIDDRCEGYDISEETYLWLDDTGHGRNGAPYDMKALYEDMEACLEMLEELRDALKEGVN